MELVDGGLNPSDGRCDIDGTLIGAQLDKQKAQEAIAATLQRKLEVFGGLDGLRQVSELAAGVSAQHRQLGSVEEGVGVATLGGRQVGMWCHGVQGFDRMSGRSEGAPAAWAGRLKT